MGSLAAFAGDQGVRGAEISGIGAFERAVIGFYDFGTKDYQRIPVEEETELLALLGNVSVTDEGPRVHLHATLGRRDGSAAGGHLFEAHVSATVEAFLREEPVELRRTMDDGVGLPLLDL